MAERFLPHIFITLAFGIFMGAAAISTFFSKWLIAIPCWIVSLVLVWLQVRERRSLKVEDIATAKKAVSVSGYGVTQKGNAAMREYLNSHPDDYQVALTFARSLSKYRLDDEGKNAYELAAKGALRHDMKLAVEIFREYLSRYLKPFDHKLTYKLSLVAEQYQDGHLATLGLESIFNDSQAGREMKEKALQECVRICRSLGLDDAAATYEGLLKGQG